MSKNTKIADLINYISVDESGNVVLSTGGQVATQSYVTTAVSNLVNSAPSTLDTLNELAAALGNDANFATTVTNSIATKQAQLNGTGFIKANGTTIIYDNSYYVSGIGSSTYLPIWDTNGTSLGNSRISQPDSSNVVLNFADTYAQGGKFTLISAYKSQLKLGRTGVGQDSNVDLIYDIEGTEVFEIRRNYSAATFKVSLGSTAHLTISSSGAATFNNTLQTGGNINLVASGGALVFTNTASANKRWDISSSANDFTINETGISERVRIVAGGATTFNSSVTASSFIKSGGTSSQYLMADGSVSSGTSGSYLPLSGGTMTGQIIWTNGAAPISFQQGGNTGTYTQTTIYANQNNTPGDVNNGIFIERGYTDTSNTELRHFVIGARGGSIQWKMNGTGYTTQYDTAEVKARADGLDLFVGRYSGGSAKLFRVYQSGADGYLELSTGASNIVTKLSGYGGTASYFLSNVGVGTTNPGYRFDVDGGNITGAAFRATKQSSQGDGLVAYFTNSSNGGYSSYIYIGSNPGTDWKIGKNISNPTSAVYHFEIVDSSNNVRMQINNTTGNVTFSGSVTQNSDIRLKINIRNIDNPLNKILQARGVLYDRVDTTEKNEFGFIAQELEQIFPELIVTNDFGLKSIKYQNIVAVLVEAIKELKAENDELRAILNRNNII